MTLGPKYKSEFRRRLRAWYRQAMRDLPWRRTRDPYAVWVSEIMLQQTRVTAAVPYYARFLKRFPDLATLAAAPEEELLAHWAGLGYYQRARNLQKAARQMTSAGEFPSRYEDIRALPGVGDYTAAAVASISFNLPHAVLDGNVFRVLSRVMNDATDIAAPAGKQRFAKLAGALLDTAAPGEYNQALMELGATLCLPKNPRCEECPVAQLCAARAAGRQAALPVKTSGPRTLDEQRTVYWIERKGQLLLWRRPAGERLMPGFWELPEAQQIPRATALETLGAFRHAITFHRYRFEVIEARVPRNTGVCEWVDIQRLATMPLSTIARKALRIAQAQPASRSVSEVREGPLQRPRIGAKAKK